MTDRLYSDSKFTRAAIFWTAVLLACFVVPVLIGWLA
jgi:hypothetical protein